MALVILEENYQTLNVLRISKDKVCLLPDPMIIKSFSNINVKNERSTLLNEFNCNKFDCNELELGLDVVELQLNALNYESEFAQACKGKADHKRNTESKSRPISKCMSVSLYIRLEYIYTCAILAELKRSQVYKNLFLTNLNNKLGLKQKQLLKDGSNIPVIKISLEHNIPELIDYKWGYRCNFMVQERQHLDNLMSWLSTLGGGFSALGDYDLNFALRAEATSIKQMKIAFRLGDQTLISRCWLYYALSLIQKQKYKKAAIIILNEFNLAKSKMSGSLDWRLTNMCKGIWTKLKHERQQFRLISLSRRL